MASNRTKQRVSGIWGHYPRVSWKTCRELTHFSLSNSCKSLKIGGRLRDLHNQRGAEKRLQRLCRWWNIRNGYPLLRGKWNRGGQTYHCQMVVNHTVELTEEEKEQARQDAIERLRQEEMAKLRKPIQPQESHRKETPRCSTQSFWLLTPHCYENRKTKIQKEVVKLSATLPKLTPGSNRMGI